jgi:hypothetical protein
MTERGLLGWRFKDRTPLWFTSIVAVLIGDSVVHFLLLMTVSVWAQSSRDSAHTYLVPFRDGVNYFVQPLLGLYLDTHWIGAFLFALLILLLFLNRNRLERASD